MRNLNEYNRNRIIELDCLRGLAAISVMLFHYTTRYEQLFGHNDKNIINFSYGKYGVQFFLITSGFILMYSFKKGLNPKKFIIKKLFRLYPAYIICITLTYIILNIYPLEGRTVGIKEFLINLTMLQGFLNIDYVDGAHWYLTIEIIFTFWSCIFLIFINKIGNVNSELLLYIWLFISIIIKIFSDYLPFNNIINSILLINYSPFFIMGLQFYKLKQKGNIHNKIILGICLLFVISQRDYQLIVSTVVLLIIYYLLINNKLNFIINRVLIFTGGISYSLYLIHQNIGYVIINYLENQGYSSIASILTSCFILIIIATIISTTIEKPILKQINRKIYSK